MKPRLMIALLIIGVLIIPAAAQENSSEATTNTVMAGSPRQQTSDTAIPSTGTQVPLGARDAEANAQPSSDNGQQRIVVDVWSSATSAEETEAVKLSPRFAVTALNTGSRLQFTERRIANSIKMGYPLGEFWIQTDFDAIDDSLRLATLSATTEADRQALQQLQEQTNRLRAWSDWLIDQNRHLRLADYYISPAPLDNDERFQSAVACTKFLLSMFSSGRLAEDNSCR